MKKLLIILTVISFSYINASLPKKIITNKTKSEVLIKFNPNCGLEGQLKLLPNQSTPDLFENVLQCTYLINSIIINGKKNPPSIIKNYPSGIFNGVQWIRVANGLSYGFDIMEPDTTNGAYIIIRHYPGH